MRLARLLLVLFAALALSAPARGQTLPAPLDAGILSTPAVSSFAVAPDSTLWFPDTSGGYWHYSYGGALLATASLEPATFRFGFTVTADSLLVAGIGAIDESFEQLRVFSPHGQLLRTIAVPAVFFGVTASPDSMVWVAILSDPREFIAYNPRTGATVSDFAPPMPTGLAYGFFTNDNDEITVVYAVNSTTYGLRRYTAGGTFIAEFTVTHPSSQQYTFALQRHSGSILAIPSPAPTSGPAVIVLSDAGVPLDTMYVAASGPNVSAVGVDDDCHILVARNDAIHAYTADIDADGICDDWEVLGLQVGTGIANLTLPYAMPQHRNLYLEYDAMANCHPAIPALDSVRVQLLKIPSSHMLPPNPDGTNGIALFIDSTQVETNIAVAAVPSNPWSQFDAIRDSMFARTRPSAERRARARVYRYVLFDSVWSNPQRYAGEARSIPAFHGFLALGQFYGQNAIQLGRIAFDGGQFMHELGHMIGLRHGGRDDINYKPNYKSVMNYLWTTPRAGITPYWAMAYSGAEQNWIDEHSLNEPAGLGGPLAESTLVGPHFMRAPLQLRGCMDPRIRIQKVSAWASLDYNCDHLTSSTNAGPRNITAITPRHLPGTPVDGLDTLAPTDDGYYIFMPTAVSAARGHQRWHTGVVADTMGVVAMTAAEASPYVAMFEDRNNNGVADGNDILAGSGLDQDEDWVLDDYEGSRLTRLKAIAVTCPGGDADTIGVRVALAGTFDGDAVIDSGAVYALRASSSTGSVMLFRPAGGGWSVTDTLGALAADTVAQAVTLGTTWASGCGTLVLRVVKSGRVLRDSVVIDVRSLDLDTRVIGAVDKFDQVAIRALALSGDPTPCGDFDGTGTVSSGDTLLVAAHLGHAIGRRLLAPNGERLYGAGLTMNIKWLKGLGDSARVTLNLLRDSEPGVRTVMASSVADSGAWTWAIPGSQTLSADYRVEVVHLAGVHENGDARLGSDVSDNAFTITAATDVTAGLPLQFSLLQNQPNPFGATTQMGFELPTATRVTLDVFELQGRRVRRLLNTQYPGGRWSVRWDGRDGRGEFVKPGVYFYTMQAGTFVARRKLVLLR